MSLASQIFGSAICGVSLEQRAYCWGALLIGYDGGWIIGSEPQPIGGDLTFASIRLASRHFCGLTPSRVAHCAGDYRTGVRGTGQPLADVFAPPDLTLNPVAGGLAFTQVALSLGNSCGLDAAGAAYCWGSEVALGNPEAALVPLEQCGYTVPPFYGRCSHAPVAVAGSHSFTSLAAGEAHICGLTQAGEVYCWGPNEAGQLGTGDTLYAAAPVRALLPQKVQALTAGYGFTCAILANAQASCWGRSNWGQTGSGSTEDAVLLPVAVAGALSYRGLSAGRDHVCGLVLSGDVYCWGSNSTGQLGHMDLVASPIPQRVELQ